MHDHDEIAAQGMEQNSFQGFLSCEAQVAQVVDEGQALFRPATPCFLLEDAQVNDIMAGVQQGRQLRRIG